MEALMLRLLRFLILPRVREHKLSIASLADAKAKLAVNDDAGAKLI